MVWNYRIGTKLFSYKKEFEGKNEKLADRPDERLFSVIEVHYESAEDADNGKASSYGEVNALSGWENMKDLEGTYKLIKKAFKKPILDLDNWPKKWKKNRINKACSAYPCHENLEDCTFCYCPLYPCYDTSKGTLIIHNNTWDCTNCTWPHEKERVDKLFQFLKESWKG